MDQRKKRQVGLLLYLACLLVFLGAYIATVTYQFKHHVRQTIVPGGQP